jgi:CelD/BcsL family acetyltransferase involved in cellulose biosynthesis
VHGRIESPLRVEWRPLAELAPMLAQWRELAGRAIEPNVFYEPAFAMAAAPVLGGDVGAGLVWSRAAPPRLLGFFPARIERRRYGIALPVLVGWTHPYAPLGSPLVDRAMCDGVMRAWLDHVAHHPQLPKVMLLPYLPVEGSLAAALDLAVEQRGGRSAFFARHARAVLAPADARDNYLAKAVDRKKRKELRRQRKRLGERGCLMSIDANDRSAVARALDDFLLLEAQGWKGRAGTAARCDDRIAGFMQTAVTALAGEGKARIARLCIDGKPIAAMVTLRSGEMAWCWKIAYDESHARFSPGVQVLLDVTEMLLADRTITCTDSCATSGHPMIDHVWRQRRMLADRLLSPGPGAALGFTLACGLEALRRCGLGAAKAVRDVARRFPCIR